MTNVELIIIGEKMSIRVAVVKITTIVSSSNKIGLGSKSNYTEPIRMMTHAQFQYWQYAKIFSKIEHAS